MIATPPGAFAANGHHNMHVVAPLLHEFDLQVVRRGLSALGVKVCFNSRRRTSDGFADHFATSVSR